MHEGFQDIPTLLSRRREDRSNDRELLGAGCLSETAGDFLFDLHHPHVAFGLIVGEGHVRIIEEAQRVFLAMVETREEIVAGAAWRTAARIGFASCFAEWRLRFMKGEALGKGGVIAPALFAR